MRPVPEFWVRAAMGFAPRLFAIVALAPNSATLRLPHERSRTTAHVEQRRAARHASRHREGEPARAAGRLARADAASGRARLGAYTSAHHHRFLRVAARAHHRGAAERRKLPGGADADPPGGLSPYRRGGAVVREHAVQPALRSPDTDRPVRHLERRPRENGI